MDQTINLVLPTMRGARREGGFGCCPHDPAMDEHKKNWGPVRDQQLDLSGWTGGLRQ